MQLTLFTDYSLRVLVFLDAHPDRLCTISEAAEAYRISGNHLMKVVNRLSSVGYIETVRGKGGGMRLSRAPKMINLGDVVRHGNPGRILHAAGGATGHEHGDRRAANRNSDLSK